MVVVVISYTYIITDKIQVSNTVIVKPHEVRRLLEGLVEGQTSCKFISLNYYNILVIVTTILVVVIVTTVLVVVIVTTILVVVPYYLF